MSLPTPYYDKDGITIYCADCRDVLPYLEPVDLVLTDPPYGIGESSKNFASRGKLANADRYEKSDWDDEPPSADTINQAISRGRNAIVFGGNYFHLPPSSCWLVWDKDNGGNDFADCELAWTNLRKAVRRKRYRWNGMIQEHMGRNKEFREHPTQKPVAVMAWALDQAGPSVRTILDPFMGSGTTLVAAKLAGCRAIGIELEERYCEIAVKRLRQKTIAWPVDAGADGG